MQHGAWAEQYFFGTGPQTIEDLYRSCFSVSLLLLFMLDGTQLCFGAPMTLETS